MKIQFKSRIIILQIILLLSINIAFSQSNGDFKITKSTINSGGNQMSGGEFVVYGSSGQTFVDQISSFDWQIHSGFWPSHNNLLDIIFKNGFEQVVNTFSLIIFGRNYNNV